jgi:hypothetical protein
MITSLEEALHDCYRGQTNVAHAAKNVGMPLAEFQQAFRNYVKKTPIDPELWKGDVVISWPWM